MLPPALFCWALAAMHLLCILCLAAAVGMVDLAMWVLHRGLGQNFKTRPTATATNPRRRPPPRARQPPPTPPTATYATAPRTIATAPRTTAPPPATTPPPTTTAPPATAGPPAATPPPVCFAVIVRCFRAGVEKAHLKIVCLLVISVSVSDHGQAILPRCHTTQLR